MCHFNREGKESLPGCWLIWYSHRYYLTLEENSTKQQKFEPFPNNEQPKPKKPRSADDYARCRYVIPSTKAIGDHKHGKAYTRRSLQQTYWGIWKKEPR